MNAVDWGIVTLYLAGMLLLAAWLGRAQRASKDYFLAGNAMGPGALAASTIATQCSTNSLLGAPAFVGFTLGGGLVWLQYELAVPLAMAALLFLVVPARRSGITSIYAILESRLGSASRRTASASFLLFRGVATGVTIYGIALVLALIMDIGFAWAVALLMGVTLVYDLLGGLRAVVVSDVLQLGLLAGTVLVALALLAGTVPVSDWFAARTDTLVNDWGTTGNSYGFWPMLIGGFFLYSAYYGCDQSQTQRLLAARSASDTARVLVLNGVLRFPLVLAYCLLGLALAAYASTDPEFITSLPRTDAGSPNYNLVFPSYVLSHFAPGFVGLVMVGLIAAAMSSIDSAINSLSAATVEDFIAPFTDLSPAQGLLVSRLTTLFWGLATVLFSFQVERIAPTVLEAINKVGSMANGPLLALFCCALWIPRWGQRAALIGFAAGLGANLCAAFALPELSWLWWNVLGWAVALVVAGLLGRGQAQRCAPMDSSTTTTQAAPAPSPDYPDAHRRRDLFLLAAMALLIVLIALAFDRIGNG